MSQDAITDPRKLSLVWLLFVLLLISGCGGNAADDELNGRITLWHSWPPAEAAALERALDLFEEIHPDVRVTAIALPKDYILEEFMEAGNDGLGPGLLLGSDSWIGELVEAGMLRSLSPDEISSSLSNNRNRALVEYESQLFGVPLFVGPQVLYFNKRMVDQPAGNLDELLQEAEVGNRVAFVPNFEEAYWGIQAFGEGLFDDQHRFTLAESGYKDWLSWLNSAQGAPGVILSEDDDSLFDLFASGQVAYYVAGPEKLAQLAAMAAEGDTGEALDFGVVPLPEGSHGAAGPLLPAETILLYAFTSAEQTRVANALATFLVNQQQSIRFMREIDRAPANPTVGVDKRIYPNVSGFSDQARTAVVIPNEIATDPLLTAGNRAYVSVLSGALSPEEAVCQFGLEVAAFQGYTAADMSLPDGCELPTE
jgi:ABC-type glycerol-3-phosphate transport system substrate-binding protein